MTTELSFNDNELEYMIDGLRLLLQRLEERGYTVADGEKIRDLRNRIKLAFNGD